MKKLLTALAAALILSGCVYPEPEPDGDDKGHYFGTLEDINDSETFTMEDVEASVTETDQGHTIKLYKVKFATAMPVRLDIVIPGVTIDQAGNISGDEIIPQAMGGEYEKYKITNMTGLMNDSALSLDMTIGTYPTKYRGRK